MEQERGRYGYEIITPQYHKKSTVALITVAVGYLTEIFRTSCNPQIQKSEPNALKNQTLIRASG